MYGKMPIVSVRFTAHGPRLQSYIRDECRKGEVRTWSVASPAVFAGQGCMLVTGIVGNHGSTRDVDGSSSPHRWRLVLTNPKRCGLCGASINTSRRS